MLETILLAIGPGDSDRVDALVNQTIAVAEPTDATVVLAHIIESDEYENEVHNYHDAIDQMGIDLENRDLSPETLAKETEPIGEITDRLDEAGIDVDIRAGVGDRLKRSSNSQRQSMRTTSSSAAASAPRPARPSSAARHSACCSPRRVR